MATGQLRVSHDAVLARLVFREEAFLPVSERLHGLAVHARYSSGSWILQVGRKGFWFRGRSDPKRFWADLAAILAAAGHSAVQAC